MDDEAKRRNEERNMSFRRFSQTKGRRQISNEEQKVNQFGTNEIPRRQPGRPKKERADPNQT